MVLLHIIHPFFLIELPIVLPIVLPIELPIVLPIELLLPAARRCHCPSLGAHWVLLGGPRVLGRTGLGLAWGAKGPGPGRLGS